jgi:hypothetical protein
VEIVQRPIVPTRTDFDGLQGRFLHGLGLLLLSIRTPDPDPGSSRPRVVLPKKGYLDPVRQEVASRRGKILCKIEHCEFHHLNISLIYEKSSIPLECVCPNGHKTTISWNNFQKGQGCRVCAGNEKFSYEQVSEYYLFQGCKLLEDNYKNSMTPMKYRCKCGTVSAMLFRDFKQGHRCQECMKANLSARFRMDHSLLVAYYKQKGCELAGEYVNNRTPVAFQCHCGRMGNKTLNNFQKSPQCAQCGHEQKSGDKCHMWNPDRDQVAFAKSFRKRCGNALARCLRATGQNKIATTREMLGYSPHELQDHIFNHPDYKGGEFHIDHIFPIQAFLDHGITDMKIINCLENLRPMSVKDNISKGHSYDVDEFSRWMENCYLFFRDQDSNASQNLSTSS